VAQVVRLCDRHGCKLTALWQVGLLFWPRWDITAKPIEAWTSLCVCGMCIDMLTLDAFGELPTNMASSLTQGHPDAVRIEISRDDISDGYWRDPNHPEGRVPV
jgi:hypothetical protein